VAPPTIASSTRADFGASPLLCTLRQPNYGSATTRRCQPQEYELAASPTEELQPIPETDLEANARWYENPLGRIIEAGGGGGDGGDGGGGSGGGGGRDTVSALPPWV
jgi:uncharacterized membrane protein YgcG